MFTRFFFKSPAAPTAPDVESSRTLAFSSAPMEGAILIPNGLCSASSGQKLSESNKLAAIWKQVKKIVILTSASGDTKVNVD